MMFPAPSVLKPLRRLMRPMGVIVPLGALWILTLWPVTAPGSPWIEGVLALTVVLQGRDILRAGFAPVLLEPVRLQAVLTTAAVIIALSSSFLLSVLHALGRFPRELLDHRGGPVLLYVAAATLMAVRLFARGGPLAPPTAGGSERDDLPPSQALPAPATSSTPAPAAGPTSQPSPAEEGPVTVGQTALFGAASVGAACRAQSAPGETVAGRSCLRGAARTATLCGLPLLCLSTSILLPASVPLVTLHVVAAVVSILAILSPDSIDAVSRLRETVTRFLREHVLVSDAEPDIESAARIDWVLFERRGVLTAGQPKVTGVHVLQEGLEKEDLLHLAAVAEYGVAHPVRDAILEVYRSNFPTIGNIKEVEFLEGRGVRTQHRGRELLFGNLRLFREAGWPEERLHLVESGVRDWSGRGETIVFLALGGELVGAISVLDPLRADARETMTELLELGVGTAVQSGDAEESVRGLCTELPEVEIHAGVPSQERQQILAQKQSEKRRVAVVRKLDAAELPRRASSSFCLEWLVPERLHGRWPWAPRRAAAVRRVPVRGERLLHVATFLGLARSVVRAERRAVLAFAAVHAALVPIVSGALYPWLGIPPLPTLAAILAPAVHRLVLFLARGREESSEDWPE